MSIFQSQPDHADSVSGAPKLPAKTLPDDAIDYYVRTRYRDASATAPAAAASSH